MSSDKVKFTKEVKEKWEQELKDDDPLNWIVLEFGTDRKHKNRVRVFFFVKNLESERHTRSLTPSFSLISSIYGF